ncbi:hypothetical protein NAEGRDRAFT_31967 [Naegleria gruberi]|uniref:Actin n=1 Tax=Naegleria gruberi TaxID=5762 RepID=D2V8V0_NAEGR|nr:uncharacterized protein NAEGRDRAFT_31967 [Naegleria gruberi]EFC46757.1 hypothetical protein NAEGRDRAFT_31967 [Naegleria gruberi]|eukprot:XP_002679501.1 hypothetical protein NAEGRDRAFT_31967 [Naegleria gruberi strain NEG-M]
MSLHFPSALPDNFSSQHKASTPDYHTLSWYQQEIQSETVRQQNKTIPTLPPKTSPRRVNKHPVTNHGCIVLDNGTENIKIGLSGTDFPQFIIPTIIGKHQKYAHYNTYGEDALHAQREASSTSQKRRSETNPSPNYQFICPIEKGVVISIEEMENFWNHLFKDKMRVNLRENGVVMNENISIYHSLESIGAVEKYREDLTQLMFEKFEIPFLYMAIPQVMSLYSKGKTSGFCVDMGHSLTSGISVLDGIAYFQENQSNSYPTSLTLSPSEKTYFNINIGGRELSEHFSKLIQDNPLNNNLRISTSAEREFIEGLKKRSCYLATDFSKEVAKYPSPYDDQAAISPRGQLLEDDAFQLPDGKTIWIGKEKFVCCEMFFQPSLYNLSNVHSSSTTYKNEEDYIPIQETLLGNIHVFGGTSLMKGLENRLLRDVKRELALRKRISVSQTKVKVFSPDSSSTCASTCDLENSAWIGSSILSSFNDFLNMDQDSSQFSHNFAMTRRVYEEEGAQAIHKYYNTC